MLTMRAVEPFAKQDGELGPGLGHQVRNGLKPGPPQEAKRQTGYTFSGQTSLAKVRANRPRWNERDDSG